MTNAHIAEVAHAAVVALAATQQADALYFGDAQSVPATGTITLASVIATDAVTVGGTTFTCVASGATGNQFNKGTTDAQAAANLAAAINAAGIGAYAAVDGTTAEQVNVTANQPGTEGNAIAMSTSDTTITLSGATLENGTASDWASLSAGQRSEKVAIVDALAEADHTPEREHAIWTTMMEDAGWVYGAAYDADPGTLTHPDLVAYEDLSYERRTRDDLFFTVARALLAA